MREDLHHQIKGYLNIKLEGMSPERFFNLCKANEIEIWHVNCEKGIYSFNMTKEGFKAVKPLVKKAKVRLKIEKKFGLPFFLYRNQKRKLYFMGLLTFFILLYGMSLFVWDINIEGNTKYTDDMMLDFLESRNITYGMYKNKISCEELEADIRSVFGEITWVSARVKGTRLEIQIKENEVILNLPPKDQSPCNLVAAKDGVIESMVVRSGKPLVKVGDQVVKGQVLVEGMIPITNDGEEVVNTHYIHADGDILAKTSTEIEKKIPLYHTVESDTGRERIGLYLRFSPYTFVYLLPGEEESHWKTQTDIRQLKLFESFYLPIYVGEIRSKEFIPYEKNYSEEELKQLSKQYLNEIIENLMEKGVQIIEKNDKMSVSGQECQFMYQLQTIEEIGQEAAINETEETDQSDERN